MSTTFGFTIAIAGESAGRQLLAAKTIHFRGEGQFTIRDYDNVAWWRFRPFVSPHHAAFVGVLRVLATNPSVMIMMGAPRPGLDLSLEHRRLSAVSHSPDEITIVSIPRGYIVIDVDDVPVHRGWGRPEKLPDVARHVRDQLLPDEFHHHAVVVTATSSTGLKGPNTARLRLFFLLDREHPLGTLRNWAVHAKQNGLPVDPAVLLPGQPIYTARPQFINGQDPVAKDLHAFVLSGFAGNRVPLDVERYTPPPLQYPIGREFSGVRSGFGSHWQSYLEANVGGPEGFFKPLSSGLGIAARSSATTGHIVGFTLALIAARADPGRQRHYDREWIIRTLASFRSADARGAAAISQMRERLFAQQGAR